MPPASNTNKGKRPATGGAAGATSAKGFMIHVLSAPALVQTNGIAALRRFATAFAHQGRQSAPCVVPDPVQQLVSRCVRSGAVRCSRCRRGAAQPSKARTIRQAVGDGAWLAVVVGIERSASQQTGEWRSRHCDRG